MAKSSNTDWEAIEREYRAGIRSLRDIGKEFSVSEGAIRKKAKTETWDRDLSAKIAARVETLVRKEEVRKQVRSDGAHSDKEQIAINAQVAADAILNQRRDVTRGRSIVQKLFEELESQIDGIIDLEELGELMRKPDDKGLDKLNDIYHKVISLSSRTDTAKKLAEALRILVELERKVLRIKDDDPGERPQDALSSLLDRIAANNANRHAFPIVSDDEANR